MADDYVSNHNNEIINAAVRYIKQTNRALADAGIEPRFDYYYEGFGSGGTAGATMEQIIQSIRGLTSAQGPEWRFNTRIKFITIKVTAKDTFS
jgi:hypothetical protein